MTRMTINDIINHETDNKSHHSTIGLNLVVSAVTLIPGNVLTVLIGKYNLSNHLVIDVTL